MELTTRYLLSACFDKVDKTERETVCLHPVFPSAMQPRAWESKVSGPVLALIHRYGLFQPVEPGLG